MYTKSLRHETAGEVAKDLVIVFALLYHVMYGLLSWIKKSMAAERTWLITQAVLVC